MAGPSVTQPRGGGGAAAAALIRSLGFAHLRGPDAAAGSADQITAPCFRGDLKRWRRKAVGKYLFSVPEAVLLHLFGAFVLLPLSDKCSSVHRSSFGVEDARGEHDSLWVNLISAG